MCSWRTCSFSTLPKVIPTGNAKQYKKQLKIQQYQTLLVIVLLEIFNETFKNQVGLYGFFLTVLFSKPIADFVPV